MAKQKRNESTNKNNGATVGYEAQLWQMADALRGTLLPKLMSGELRVKHLERFIQEAI